MILLLSVLSFTAARSNDMVFTFSIICMTNNATDDLVSIGTQFMEQLLEFQAIPFSPADMSLSFAGAGAGAILMSLPLALLLHEFGGR